MAKLAFIGFGVMGAPMAGHLAAPGMSLSSIIERGEGRRLG